MEYATVMWK